MYCLHDQLKEVDDSVVLWKYMSLSKFIALLVDNGLWFNRIDCFEDVFEGRFPDFNEKLRPEVYGAERLSKEQYSIFEKQSRESLFVSCFHANDYESAAMWTLYSKVEGIAIQTTAKNLKKAFSSEKRHIYNFS